MSLETRAEETHRPPDSFNRQRFLWMMGTISIVTVAGIRLMLTTDTPQRAVKHPAALQTIEKGNASFPTEDIHSGPFLIEQDEKKSNQLFFIAEGFDIHVDGTPYQLLNLQVNGIPYDLSFVQSCLGEAGITHIEQTTEGMTFHAGPESHLSIGTKDMCRIVAFLTDPENVHAPQTNMIIPKIHFTLHTTGVAAMMLPTEGYCTVSFKKTKKEAHPISVDNTIAQSIQ